MNRNHASVNETKIAEAAARVIHRCEQLAQFSERNDCLQRTFCSAPMHDAQALIVDWMRDIGLHASLDAAGNLIGQTGTDREQPVLLIGSHLDTVVNAGKFDGTLGVLLGLAIVELLRADNHGLAFEIAVVGFSEEEGVRFNTPYIGSRAIAGSFDPATLDVQDKSGVSIRAALRSFGCDTSQMVNASFADRNLIGFLEAHIEQGPVLESENCPVGIVTAIAGQTRVAITFTGTAGHAGTVPMALRRDALAGAAELIGAVEKIGRNTPGLFATVGDIRVSPNVSNVIAGQAVVCLDLRHEQDEVRQAAFESLVQTANSIASQRNLFVEIAINLDQAAVTMNSALIQALQDAIRSLNYPIRLLPSGAGHDAAVMAQAAPTAMLFVRCRNGISHHPDEHVEEQDVSVALRVMFDAIQIISDRHATRPA